MMNTISIAKLIGILFFIVSIVTGCSSGGDGTSTFTVGGTVSGLTGSGLVLQNNVGDDLAISADGNFNFATALANGAAYAVTVATQPSGPTQTCTVANGTGTLSGANVTDVAITCTTNTYDIRVTVEGLVDATTDLVLNNGGDELTINANDTYTLSTDVASGETYDVTVTNPTGPNQTCTPASTSGTVGGDNVDVAITCATNTYTIGGNVSLIDTVVLRNNGGDDQTIDANGPYTFALTDGSSYNITAHPPLGQTCSITNHAGTLNGANVTDIDVTCSTTTYSISGTIDSLEGSGLTLTNGVDQVTIDPLATVFSFPIALAEGTDYAVDVFQSQQPSNPSQTCQVTSGASSGTLIGNVTDIGITCTTNTYDIRITVEGLVDATTDLVLNNGADELTINADNTYTLSTDVLSGETYDVIVTNPTGPNQTCTPASTSGTVGGDNVDVAITCTTNTYTVGGTVTGLTGTGLELSNGGVPLETLPISGNGAFVFTNPMNDGSSYNVTVTGQPSGPVQNCLVSNGSGTLSGDNVANVSILCTSSVAARYPTNGANWNDYVINNGPDGDGFSADDTACTGTENSYAGCLHGGEMRVVTLPDGYSSCTDLTAADTLNAFNWRCDQSTNPVRFISTGLSEGMNLSNLINFTTPGWLENAVTISESGTPIAETPTSAWWTNPISVDNDGGSLATTSTIYLVTTDPAADYIIDADKVGLVIQPGAVMTGTSTVPRDHDAVSAAAHQFLWLEGDINAIRNLAGIRWTNVSHSVMREVRVLNSALGLTGAANIYLDGSSNNALKRIRVVKAGDDGIMLMNNSTYNTISDIRMINNRMVGMTLDNSTNNLFINVVSANNNNETGPRGAGIFLNAASNDNKFINVTIANNRINGMTIVGSAGNLMMNMAVANHFTGLFIRDGSDRLTFADLASANNQGGHSAVLRDVNNNKFTGIFKIGSNLGTDCLVQSLTPPADINPGLVDNTCNVGGIDGSNDYGGNNALSDAILETEVTMAASFGGKVMIDDTENASDTAGANNDYANISITDWLNFENFYRGWGLDHTDPFPSLNNAGPVPLCLGYSTVDPTTCTNNGGDWRTDARIWDWSLITGDDGDNFGPVLFDVLGVPTGNLTITHTWSDDTPSSPFLRHAVEILGDAIGNDNGLCEPSEACIHTRNIGAYQGHGTLVTVPFTDGAITAVQLYQYQDNGDL